MPITRARLKISDYNKNRKTRLRNQEKKMMMASLSLTSMVDMFAILVIFLLTSASSVSQWIEIAHNIDLPKAKHSDQPPKAAALEITGSTVYADKHAIVSVAQVLQAPPSGVVEPIRAYLAKHAKKDGYITVVASQKLPFGVIRRVISTCQGAGFPNVNLAVQPN